MSILDVDCSLGWQRWVDDFSRFPESPDRVSPYYRKNQSLGVRIILIFDAIIQ